MTSDKSIQAQDQPGAQLLRLPYVSVVDDLERDCFLYLSRGYKEDADVAWPVLVFLHGDGERGDGKADLDYVLKYGPIYEAWIQKQDFPFIIISPQLHMFGRDGEDGPEYILNRTLAEIPKRLAEGAPEHNKDMPSLELSGPMVGAEGVVEPDVHDIVLDTGWNNSDPDVITILDAVLAGYNADASRVYLTGVSMGGFGTWYYASHYPDKFAAIMPVVGYPTLEDGEAVGKAGIPTWIFSGGRDLVVPTQNFFAGMNKIEEMGVTVRFTTEQDMSHDVWNRVYARRDVYDWLLQYIRE